MKRIFLVFFLLITSVSAAASPQWYRGSINRIWPNSDAGGFIITFSGSSSLSDCKHQYAYFRKEEMSSERLKSSFSVALSAFHAGITVGVVIDKAKGEGEGYCRAISIDMRK